MTEISHWGEIPTEETTYVPDVSADIEMAMSNINLMDYNTTCASNAQKIEYINLEPADPLVMYAITLHKYASDITEMIRVAELAIESDLIPPIDATSPIPEMPNIVRKHIKNHLNYIHKEFTPFSTGQAIEILELSQAAARQLLSKSIATLLAHIGFETSHQSVLDLLTDVVDAFFKKVTFHLKLAEEDEERNGSGFPHTIERVLVEVGLGGLQGLHDYYQTRVIKYVSVLQRRCKELNTHYENLLFPKSLSPVDKLNKSVRVKVEEEDDVIEIDNPQVHFPSIDGEIGLSSLETGFQLLNSLEAEANLQNLGDNEEDACVTISPGIVSIPESELASSLSPFNKKKRMK